MFFRMFFLTLNYDPPPAQTLYAGFLYTLTYLTTYVKIFFGQVGDRVCYSYGMCGNVLFSMKISTLAYFELMLVMGNC